MSENNGNNNDVTKWREFLDSFNVAYKHEVDNKNGWEFLTMEAEHESPQLTGYQGFFACVCFKDGAFKMIDIAE